MPLVLAQNEKSAAGIVYADKLGVSYEFRASIRSLDAPIHQPKVPPSIKIYQRSEESRDGGCHPIPK